MDAEVLVLGTGGVGSAALYHLARRGIKAIGVDRFPPGHDRGSSHGRTRLIRLAYFEHPQYIPLLRRAFALWEELQCQIGSPIYHENGLLQSGPPDGELIPGILTSAAQHNLEIERFDAAGARRRFPGIRIPDHHVVMFDRRAGYLQVEECVKGHAQLAQELGAQILTGEEVKSWELDECGDAVTVVTATRRLRACRLIITAGSWASSLLSDIPMNLQVLRKPVFWFPCASKELSAEGGCPNFLMETPDGYYYGVPQVDDLGIKIARHTGGDIVADPLLVDRNIYPRDLDPVVKVIQDYFGLTNHTPTHSSVCMYTMSPNGHFIVDHHPRSNRVAFAAGLSGHGFKFTGVLGQILTQLVLDGQSDLPVDFLRWKH